MNAQFEQWLEKASTPTLEANLAAARNAEEKRAIAEELANRGQLTRDTGTMSLPFFNESTRTTHG